MASKLCMQPRRFTILAGMKQLLVFLVFLLVGYAAQAQVPVKRANTILVTLPDSSEAAWKHVARVLVEKGYTIKDANKDLLLISTDLRSTKTAAELGLTASVSGRVVTLRGKMLVRALGPGLDDVEYRGMNNSLFMSCWQQMHEVATALGGTVTYERR